jgi:hypothetical protein
LCAAFETTREDAAPVICGAVAGELPEIARDYEGSQGNARGINQGIKQNNGREIRLATLN